jgi:hypothetical protein
MDLVVVMAPVLVVTAPVSGCVDSHGFFVVEHLGGTGGGGGADSDGRGGGSGGGDDSIQSAPGEVNLYM